MKTKFINSQSKYNAASSLTEAGQANKLRWQLCLPNTEQKCFEYILPLMKCKDYFNDIAYLYTYPKSKHAPASTACSQYGLYTSWLPFDALRACGGLYFHITKLHPKFFENLKNSLNPYLESTGMPIIEVLDQDETSALIFIDEAYLETTSAISAVSLFIRFINCGLTETDFKKAQQTADPGYTATQDRIYRDTFVASIPTYGWYGPDDACKAEIAMVCQKPGKEKPVVENYSNYEAWPMIHNAGYNGALGFWKIYEAQQKKAA